MTQYYINISYYKSKNNYGQIGGFIPQHIVYWIDDDLSYNEFVSTTY